MLDPLSALGVASNIVQLVGFTAEIIKESRAYVKGQKETIPSYETISELVERQQAAFNNVSAIEFPVGPLDREEQHVKDLAERCVEEGRKLISILETLALAKKKIASAMLAVVKAKWKRADVEQHRQVLASYQDQLSLALINLIRCVCFLSCFLVYNTLRLKIKQTRPKIALCGFARAHRVSKRFRSKPNPRCA